MRVLYFTRGYTPHDHRFLTALAESELDVYFLRLERSGRQIEDRSLPPAVHQVQWGGGKAPFRWRDLPARVMELRGILRQIQPDVLHAGPVQTVAFIAALTGFHPLVTMSWGSDMLLEADRTAAYRQITRWVLARSTVFVGDCAAVRDKAAEYGLPPKRAYLFPWGIDLERFSPPANWRQAADRFNVLSLRSWELVYGVDVMLRGFAYAVDRAPKLHLMLLGGGSLAKMVHELIRQHRLEDNMTLGGSVSQENLPGMYRAADLYASASHSDGSSVSLMEALACGCPALVSDIPSNHEWITGEQGWLFPDGDSTALGEGILRALRLAESDPARMDAMRKAARQTAEHRADWGKNFPVLLQAYRAAVERSGKTVAAKQPL